jgi:WhiB family redox-sensing transcriptional regulator
MIPARIPTEENHLKGNPSGNRAASEGWASLLQERQPWAARAACAGLDSDTFFPEDSRQSGWAIAICAACPVRVECRDFAVDNRIKFGIWGGLTVDERRHLRKGAVA